MGEVVGSIRPVYQPPDMASWVRDQQPVRLTDFCTRFAMDEKAARKILDTYERAGLIASTMGTWGASGYKGGRCRYWHAPGAAYAKPHTYTS